MYATADDSSEQLNANRRASFGAAREAERALVIGYARSEHRAGLEALLALDARLGELLRHNREPMMAQLRLAWWRETLASLDRGARVVDPVLIALASQVLPRGVSGTTLAALIDGWEALLEEPLGKAALAMHARERGGALFAAGAVVLGGDAAAVRLMGEGWVLADFARNTADPALAAMASSLAEAQFAAASRWCPPRLRALGGLALSARMDLAGLAPASPRRIARLALFRLTGRW